MGNEQGKGGASATPAGIQSMDENLQKKFAKGIQFNMKIVLKGDRNTGKTCLFTRMAGKGFQEAYLPTNEIQVTSILWSYKVTSDTVKVEVWDVVDKGRVQRSHSKGGLKIFNTTPEVEEEEGEEGEEGEGRGKVLDATFLNVYKGCHGIVLMFDMTKIWTWKYVERELPNIPYDIPVMVLANFRDLGDHRTITRDEVMAFIETARPEGSSEIMYAESSMKNAFGLMHLHKFLSIPFLQLQQDMLLQQIQVSREQMMAARDELSTASTTEDQNYDMFVARLQRAAEERRRKAQKQEEEGEEALEATDAPIAGTTRQAMMDSERGSTPSAAHPQTTPTAERRDSKSSGKKESKLSRFWHKNKDRNSQTKGPIPVSPSDTSTSRGTAADIEEFVPEGEVDSFLDDTGEEEEEEESEEESSEAGAHPVIARDEDLSSGDDTPPSPAKPVSLEALPVVRRDTPVRPLVQLKSAKDIELTESEEEEKEELPRSTPNKQNDLESYWGRAEGKEGGEGEAKPKAKPKLLLDWTVPEPAKTPKKKESSHDSEGKRERRKKKSSRKGSGKRKGEEAAAFNGTSTPSSAAATDPFGTSSLDAWLNSDILQPIAVSPPQGEVGEEADTEETPQRKSKKHRDRADGSRKKRRHKSRHSAKEGDDHNL